MCENKDIFGISTHTVTVMKLHPITKFVQKYFAFHEVLAPPTSFIIYVITIHCLPLF